MQNIDPHQSHFASTDRGRAHPSAVALRRCFAHALLPAAEEALFSLTTVGRATGAPSNSPELARARRHPTIRRRSVAVFGNGTRLLHGSVAHAARARVSRAWK